MNGKLLFAGIAILILSVVYLTFLAIPNLQINPNKEQPLPGAQPSTIPTIAFVTDFTTDNGFHYSQQKIIFDVNGTYSFGDNAWLKISNTKGQVMYDFPVRSEISQNYENGTIINSFPITVYLENSGEYVATFQDVNLGNGTCLMVYSPFIQQIAPSSFEIQIFYFLIFLGFFVFSIGWALTIYKHENLSVFSGGITGFTKQEMLVFPDLGTLFSIVGSIALFLVAYIALDLFNFNIWIRATAMSGFGFLFIMHSFFSIRKLRNLFNLSYERIASIEKQATNYALISGILLLLSFFLLLLQLLTGNDIFMVLGFYNYIVATVIFLVTAPFYNLITDKGKRILPLRKFINDYQKDPQEADFNLLATAARRISKYYKFSGLLIPSTTLTVGLCNYVIMNKKTDKIGDLLKQLESEKTDTNAILSLVREFVSEGSHLEEINIKNVPSFIEEHSRELGYGSSLLVAIMTILTILSYLHFF